MPYRWTSRSGQTIVETILILPVFFLFVFGLLQMGQIGVAMVTASYAAGSIARHAVQVEGNDGTGNARLQALLYAGMTASGVQETVRPDGPTRNVTVNACIAVPPIPIVGAFLKKAVGHQLPGSDTADTCSDAVDSRAALYFVESGSGGRYYFVVRGTASARMNYYVGP